MQIEIGNLFRFYLIAVCVFLINFNFSFPRIPKIATLLYFWVFVVKVKIEISLKILDRYSARFEFIKSKIILNLLRSAKKRSHAAVSRS